MISILLPTYNQGEFIEETLETIKNQTFTNYEFIIVNDGSTDNTSEIIKKYAKNDNRIILYEQENQGTAKALNKAYTISKYDYITWVTSDNIYRPYFLQKLYEVLNNDKNVEFVFSNFEIIDKNNNNIGYWIYPEKDSSLWMKLTTGLAGMCFMYTRNAGNLTGQYKKEFIQEDFAYFAKMSELVNTVHLNQILGSTRVHPKKRGEVYKERIKSEKIVMINEVIKRRNKSNILNLDSFKNEVHYFLRFREKIKLMIYSYFLLNNDISNQNYLIFGSGALAIMIQELMDTFNISCIGFIDSFWNSTEKLYNLPVYNLSNISSLEYDKIIIASQGQNHKIFEILKKNNIPAEKIINIF